MRKGILSLLLLVAAEMCRAQFGLQEGKPIIVACHESEESVVKTALDLLARDCRAVFSAPMQQSADQGTVIIGTLGKSPLIDEADEDVQALRGKKQAFLLAVLPDKRLLIAGSDAHGTAYGIMQLSRLIGVSPWEWWADATPRKKTLFELPAGYKTLQSPSVEHRGLFINDEDWGLMPWSCQNYEPTNEKGHIGPKTNARIFELLLRLRANTYWAGMHECTLPFFLTKGNREMARKYGIFIGSSHCEPMACNAAGEWKRRGQGDYDYVNNSGAVYKFWEDRVKEVHNQEIVYTLGMRGVHDGRMQGAKTIDEQKAVLQRVLKDQRQLLQKYVNSDVTTVPQVFIPYKEILDVYNAGLEVPDDVTLMWCDDNYGYIRHFPNETERARKGGNGVYYHLSYWGRPHDYLWLGTFSPFLLYQQMKLAYDRGIRQMWVLNVGDIKPSEYQVELFMDMAWNIGEVAQTGATAHLGNFLKRELGETLGHRLLPVLTEHYRLAYIHKPEFMGNTRVEEQLPIYKVVKDLPFSEQEIHHRLAAYQELSDTVEQLTEQVAPNRRSTYSQLVKYPVQAASQMNSKLLFAQLARHGKAQWQQSDAAFDSIAALTLHYNELEGGKWKGIMDFMPRNLPVFDRVERTTATQPMPAHRPALYIFNALECASGRPVACQGLGYEGKAARIPKGEALTFAFDDLKSDSVAIEVCLLPNHPIEGGRLRFSLSLGAEERVFSYETYGRSEEWKLNVLWNQAVRRVVLPLPKQGRQRLSIKALDEGVVLDRVNIYSRF